MNAMYYFNSLVISNLQNLEKKNTHYLSQLSKGIVLIQDDVVEGHVSNRKDLNENVWIFRKSQNKFVPQNFKALFLNLKFETRKINHTSRIDYENFRT